MSTFQLKGLEQIIKALKVKPPTVLVGVLGSKEQRTPKEGEKHVPTNSEVGAVHEFGAPTKNIPERSFLKMPIEENLEKELESTGTLNEKALSEIVTSGDLMTFMKKVAVAAENIVGDAFKTQGFGKWPAWKHPEQHDPDQIGILQETQELRESIGSEVVK